MSNKIEISVVVISFNGEEFIDNCLTTVIESLQSAASELIVVDNGSTDNTLKIIDSQFNQVKLITNEINLGFAPAVNQGLEAAQGEFILILNQDTKINDNAIGKLTQRMKTDESVGSIGPKFVGFDGVIQKSSRAFPNYLDLLWHFTGLSYLFPNSRFFSRWKIGWFDHQSELEVDQPMGAALMISRQTLERVGYFDEDFKIFFNDVDYCRRIQEAGLVNLYYPDAVVAHFVGGSTRKNKARMIIESHRAMYQYFRKYNRNSPLLWFWGGVLYITAYLRAGLNTFFKI